MHWYSCRRSRSRSDIRDSLSESAGNTGGRGARRLLHGLVVVEVALALVLLVGAGLMTRSVSKLLQVYPGFEPGNLVAAHVFLPTTKYRERHRLVQFFEDVVERLRNAPGVTAASAVSALPCTMLASRRLSRFRGLAPCAIDEDPLADVRIVTPALHTMNDGLTLRRGSHSNGARSVRAEWPANFRRTIEASSTPGRSVFLLSWRCVRNQGSTAGLKAGVPAPLAKVRPPRWPRVRTAHPIFAFAGGSGSRYGVDAHNRNYDRAD